MRERQDICAIAVMAKQPLAGKAKTRLCPPLLSDQASALSTAFLQDTIENLALAAREIPIETWIAYCPAVAAQFFRNSFSGWAGLLLADGNSEIPTEIQGFGRCLFQAARWLLAEGFGAACVLNSDSPTLPSGVLVEAARALLVPGERVVLGPTTDGGYYLLGLKTAHPRMFADIAWSTNSVAETTRARAAELGIEVVELAAWYDVDDGNALARLIAELGGKVLSSGLRPFPAQTTAAALQQLGPRRSDPGSLWQVPAADAWRHANRKD